MTGSVHLARLEPTTHAVDLGETPMEKLPGVRMAIEVEMTGLWDPVAAAWMRQLRERIEAANG